MGWKCFREIKIIGNLSTAALVLKDVPGWPRWDVDLSKCVLDPPATEPAVGVKGKVYMKNGKVFDMKFLDVSPRYVAYRTEFPGCNLDWYWQFPENLEKPGDFYTLQMGVKASGFASFAYKLLLYKTCETAFDACTPEFKKVAEALERRT
mmetsp:Transcript_30933/g.50039  ORF Transcript_30933/g.50039 Transcript_30933/m.50039 type:complete len:150 (+) Transcript_30933:254-703(+)|eukprot:CAMPEP_0184656306 /NCGR_PEP_ID=MMETSP0308-20130426/16281_1 /TAXON_ID=38269 /ORGANISM="Gloeochaete witrockiana, Strain SAG 46.84" /LENGTH=149 /DNA_ID=CAMNT_0027093363 /DNA_START=252 /DNA_END=701 /DNA_ORIENTATION=-